MDDITFSQFSDQAVLSILVAGICVEPDIGLELCTVLLHSSHVPTRQRTTHVNTFLERNPYIECVYRELLRLEDSTYSSRWPKVCVP